MLVFVLINKLLLLLLLLLIIIITGVCPQQNVLFDFLTVKEHIEFYGGIKEVDQASIQDTVRLFVN